MLWLLSIAPPWQAGKRRTVGIRGPASRAAGGGQASGGRRAEWVGSEQARCNLSVVLYWNPFAAAIYSMYSYIYL